MALTAPSRARKRTLIAGDEKHNSMSILSVFDLAEPKWGLNEEDLNAIIRVERLKDMTKDFSDSIETITQKFGFPAGIKIVAFDEHSGVDNNSRRFFRLLINAGRDGL